MSDRTVPVGKVSIDHITSEETSAFGAHVFSITYGGRDRADALLVVLGQHRHERSVRVFYGRPEAGAVEQALHAAQSLSRSESQVPR
jgi:hypothetical protein